MASVAAGLVILTTGRRPRSNVSRALAATPRPVRPLALLHPSPGLCVTIAPDRAAATANLTADAGISAVLAHYRVTPSR